MCTVDTPIASACAWDGPADCGATMSPAQTNAADPGPTVSVEAIRLEPGRSPAVAPSASLEHWYLCGEGSACRSG